MIEHLLNGGERASEDDGRSPNSRLSSEQAEQNNEDFLDALPIVKKIIRRKLFSASHGDKFDLIQIVALRLWNWRGRNDRLAAEMSAQDWESFAARAALNEVNRHFRQKSNEPVESLDAAADLSSEKIVHGETAAEVESLTRFLWQAICQLTLRQRRALLLHSQELILRLFLGKVSEQELLEALHLTEAQWSEIYPKLPLSDAMIAMIDGAENNSARAAANIAKARLEARRKLKKITT